MRRQARPVTVVTERLRPRDENDPFCSCPSCGLLGSHQLAHTVYPPNEYTSTSGVTVMKLGEPAGGTPAVQRRCVFCGHGWLVPRDRDAEES